MHGSLVSAILSPRMDTPRIAIIQDQLTSSGGGEQVVLALTELFPDAPVYTSLYRSEAVPQFAKTKVIPSYLQRIPTAVRRHQLFIPLMPVAFESFDLKGFDLVISVGNGFSKGVITQPGQPHIAYIHSPARWLWNLGNDTRNKGRLDSGLRAMAEHRLRVWDVVSSERVDRFVTNSEFDAARIAKIYRRDAEVVHPPVNVDAFKPGEGKRQDYLLSVSRLVPYKRIDLVIEACKRLKRPLKIVGTGPEEGMLRDLAKGAPWIDFLGFVPDAQLETLYQEAAAFVFAAEEDFGIVPVEAMSAGCPVIAYGVGGVTESVVAGKTGEFFNEQTVDSLAEAITSFDPSAYDPKTIRAQAEKFSAARFKERMAAIVADALKHQS